MGYDTLEPFLNYEGKGIYLLAVTSNPGSADVERQELADGRRVYELVGDMGAPFQAGRAQNFRRHGGGADQCGFLHSGAHSGRSPADSRSGTQGGDLSSLSGSGHAAPP